jgi:predicted nucleic acid-binding protein
MVVVDASVWVSRLFAEDRFHIVSRRWMQEAVSKGTLLASPGILLPEVSGALARRTGDSALAHQSVQSLLRFPALRLISMRSNLVERAAELAADLRLRGADALYVAVAWQLRIPLVTWDQEHTVRVRGMISVWTPGEALGGFPGA